MQAFLWRHLVPARDLSAKCPLRPPPGGLSSSSATAVAIPAGSSASVQVDVETPGITADGPVQFELVDPPEGISVKSADPAGGHARMVLACDAKKLKPVSRGT